MTGRRTTENNLTPAVEKKVDKETEKQTTEFSSCVRAVNRIINKTFQKLDLARSATAENAIQDKTKKMVQFELPSGKDYRPSNRQKLNFSSRSERNRSQSPYRNNQKDLYRLRIGKLHSQNQVAQSGMHGLQENQSHVSRPMLLISA